MHDQQRTLQSLKFLSHERGEVSPFATHTDFLRWADQAGPLLVFNAGLTEEFERSTSAATTVKTWKPEKYVLAINNAIGAVNRAITLLEHTRAPANTHGSSSPARSALVAPDKVTLKWLYENVPLTFVGGGLGMLGAVFLLGVAFSETHVYALFRSTISAPIVSSASPAANAIKSQPEVVSPMPVAAR